MKVAITGGSGFIGTEVLKYLSKKKIKIINLYHKNKCNISSIKNIKFNYRKKKKNLYNYFCKPDILIHLAWSDLDDHLSKKHLENINYHFSFLKQLCDNQIKKIFVMGTCFEYGIDKNGCLKENLNTKPSNNYAIAKDILRKKLFAYIKKKKLKTLISWGRLFYIYGANQPSSTLFGQFLNAIKKKKKKFNMSPGDQLRDYLHVKKVAIYTSHLAILNNENNIFNICSGEPKKLTRVVTEWKNKYNYKINLNLGFYDYSNKEPMHFWGDNKKIKKLMKKSF
jgi:nucleoside-diphosphate-sugar epimerase